MAAVIFIPVFANSMGMLIAGQVLCGMYLPISVIHPAEPVEMYRYRLGHFPDSQHDVRLRGCPDLPSSLRHWLGVYVLGCRDRPVFWCRSGRYRLGGRSWMESKPRSYLEAIYHC